MTDGGGVSSFEPVASASPISNEKKQNQEFAKQIGDLIQTVKGLIKDAEDAKDVADAAKKRMDSQDQANKTNLNLILIGFFVIIIMVGAMVIERMTFQASVIEQRDQEFRELIEQRTA